ncbi:hypothetical protein CPAR01_16040 [Colletotrichum paranaense]|uniref:Uncharacterized protein n=1 Tax=Colletotrichum paranaense TaxID=1914294 RepID=A0ABQ9RXI8_9PEZI|nr:uncharacterized protein CPAR01_16040 [Colletotrichum paranaense]KAK1517560.1 hypothetical protein CPAR01_16040 [Colletotrichum paranaense]
MPGLESENRGRNDMMGVGAETVKEISQPAVAYLASVEPSFSACLTLLRALRCSHVCEVATCGGKLGRRGRHRPCGEISDDADEVRLFLGANRMTQKIPIGWERKKKEEKEKRSVVQEMELEKDVPTWAQCEHSGRLEDTLPSVLPDGRKVDGQAGTNRA